MLGHDATVTVAVPELLAEAGRYVAVSEVNTKIPATASREPTAIPFLFSRTGLLIFARSLFLGMLSRDEVIELRLGCQFPTESKHRLIL